jgi:hypothetical protein
MDLENDKLILFSNVFFVQFLHNFCTILTFLFFIFFYDQLLNLFSYMWALNIQ